MHFQFTRFGRTHEKILFRRFRRSCNRPSYQPQPSPEKKTHADRVKSLAERMYRNFNILDQRSNRARDANKFSVQEKWSKLHEYYRAMWNILREKHNSITGRNYNRRNEILNELQVLLDDFDVTINRWDSIYAEHKTAIDAQQTDVEKTEKVITSPDVQKSKTSEVTSTAKVSEQVQVDEHSAYASSAQRNVMEDKPDVTQDTAQVVSRTRTEWQPETEPLSRSFTATVGETFTITLPENWTFTPTTKQVAINNPTNDPFIDPSTIEYELKAQIPDADTLHWERKNEDGREVISLLFSRPGTANFTIFKSDETTPFIKYQYVVTAYPSSDQKPESDGEMLRQYEERESVRSKIADVQQEIEEEKTKDTVDSNEEQEGHSFDATVDWAISELAQDPDSFLAVVTLDSLLEKEALAAYKATSKEGVVDVYNSKMRYILEKGKHIQSDDGRVWQLQLDSEGKFTLEEIGE